METERLESAMKRSISEVLEKMFFLPLDFPEKFSPDPSGPGEYLVTKLRFKGPFTGHFHFFIPKKFTLALTAGFLGEDEQNITSEHRSEMVKEIVNMIAGNAFSIVDDQAIFNLEIPEIIDSPEVGKLLEAKEGVFIPIQTPDCSLALQLVREGADSLPVSGKG